MAAGYLTLQPAESWKLMRSQKNLIAKRGAIGGRVAVMKLLGLPVPRLHGFSLFQNWWQLSSGEKLRSTFGTVRRIITRHYHRPLRLAAPAENLKSAPEVS
jgi:coenzyme F420 hydrogenase subunit beta